MKKFKRSETFKGLFWPKYYKDIKRLISECKIISESIKTANFEDIVDLKFDFKRGDKVTIYREFIYAIKKGWLRVEQSVVIRYLAEQSNLADGDTLNRRINAIRQGFKRYKNTYS
jgi:predicted nucleotidyltransferase